MGYVSFDSRNPLYKSHMGAIAEGSSLRLSVLLHKDALVSEVFLVLRNDAEESPRELRMSAGEEREVYRFYHCELTLTEGLYWYSFRYESGHGAFRITKGEHSLGMISDKGELKKFWSILSIIWIRQNLISRLQLYLAVA